MSCQVAHLVLLFFITGDFSLCILYTSYLAKLGDNRTSNPCATAPLRDAL